MDYPVSRSEKKRRAKGVEELAEELAALTETDIRRLPGSEELKQEIRSARPLKGGAWKRQVKFIARLLREEADTSPFLDFMSERRGSHLKETKTFQELERLRDDIISEAIAVREEADSYGEEPEREWQGVALASALARFPRIDGMELRSLAASFARTRKTMYRREIFRLLKSAAEIARFSTEG